jgi:hypothetical protein
VLDALDPPSERALRLVCLGFALWTLCAHAVVFAGGSLSALIGLYALALALWAFAARGWRRRRADRADPAPPPAAEPAPEPEGAETPAWRGAVAPVLAGSAAALALWRASPLLTWTLWVLVLSAAAVAFVLRRPTRFEPPRRSPRAEWGLLALALACALYTLCVHRPDADDAFYVNLAVGAIDLPELPLLARDTLHGRFDLPIHYAAYRLHSWELWNAALAKLLGLPPLAIFHLVSAALAAALVPLAHAALFRRLTPRVWIWTTLALVVVLAAPGDTHRWYGNFAFVRIWQGKGVFLFVFTPLIHAYALRFAERGDRGSWLLLAAAQVAGLGCTSTAIWAAPVAALMALACALRPRPADLRRFAIGALCCAYPIAAGLAIKSDMAGAIPELARSFAPGRQLDVALHTVLGHGRLYAVCLLAVFAAWSLQRGLARRFAIVLPLAVALVLLNPWIDAWVRANVSGPSLWRVMWALPVPTLLALGVVAPLSVRATATAGGWASPRARAAACLALMLLFACWVPRFPGFDRHNGASVGWPRLVLPETERWARALNEIAPRERVVAPPSVSTWVPIRRGHAYPLMVRSYLRPLRERIGRVAYRDRMVMTQYVDGIVDHPNAAAIFARGLDLYDVRAVCVRNSETIAEARQILRRTGFTRRIQGTDFEIWAR